MSGINGILDLAMRALAAQQVAVEVAGHNISNVNTPGFCRQQVNLTTAYPLPSPWGPLGNGVRVLSTQRAFDPFLTARLDEKSAAQSQYETLQAHLERLTSLFNETQVGGLAERLSAFFAAWHDLADHPAGAGERQALLQEAQSLAEAFRWRADQLVQIRHDLGQEISPVLAEINEHARRVAELNQEIQISEANGQAANDLRDLRQRELSQLAELIGIRYYTSADGMINATLANGLPLVQGVKSFGLTAQVTPADVLSISWEGPGGLTEDITPALDGGRLTALVIVRDRLLPQYQDKLDNLARELIFALNAQHSQGVGLLLPNSVTGSYAVTDPAAPLSAAGLPFGDRLTAGSLQIFVEQGGRLLARSTLAIDPGLSLNDLVAAIQGDAALAGVLNAGVEAGKLVLTVTAPDGGVGFAADTSGILASLGINTFFTGDNAYTLAVHPWVQGHPEAIAAGLFAADGSRAPGDNRNALALAGLESAPLGPDGLTFAAAYQNLVTVLGLDAEEAGQQARYFTALVDQLTQMRDAVSGVSLDEELANLIKFQRAFQAAARLISVADELYQTILATRT